MNVFCMEQNFILTFKRESKWCKISPREKRRKDFDNDDHEDDINVWKKMNEFLGICEWRIID